MPYRVTMELDAFNGTRDADESVAQLGAMLDCLIQIDTIYMAQRLRSGIQVPLLYQSGVRYEEEPTGAEFWRDIPTVLKYGTGDCLPASTLVLTSDYRFVPIINLRPGDEIMEDGQTTIVQECVVTGEKPVLAFGLSNGCVLRLSPDHRVFRSDGSEVRAEDVRVGDDLRTPTRPFPTFAPATPSDFVRSAERLSPADFAWLVGTYVADGWCQDYRFAVSGDDDHPKRRKLEQKQRVRSIMESLGIATRWAKKSIIVNDPDLARAMSMCGTHAPQKHLPSMAWSRDQVDELLEGLATDSSTALKSGTVTYGTTSRLLALQTRVLFRMRDQSVHIREWSAEQHRGLGRNSIYRIGVRRPADECMSTPSKTKAESFRTSVRVRSIAEEEPELCVDVTTSSGRFYLPESDTIVHNCEDLACWLVVEKRVRFGIAAVPLIFPQLQKRGNGQDRYLYHVAVKLPDGSWEDPSRKLGMPG